MSSHNILVAFNSFKECADSLTVCTNFASALAGYIKSQPVIFPISDGGDGFRSVCSINTEHIVREYTIPRIYDGKAISIPVNYIPSSGTVIIESAEVIGLKLAPPHVRNPIYCNSEALGILLHQIDRENRSGNLTVNTVIIGIGGTATNDMGLGAASVFGLRLFSGENELGVFPANFIKADTIVFPSENLSFTLKLIPDVIAALYGENGCTRIFSPQKGASHLDVGLMEAGFRHLSAFLQQSGKLKYPTEECGAGGGLTVGLSLLGQTELEFSEAFVLKTLGGTEKIASCDIVITGEGKFDEQSFMNKATGIVLREAKRLEKKVFLICGSFELDVLRKLPSDITTISLSSFYNSVPETIQNFSEALQKSAKILSESL